MPYHSNRSQEGYLLVDHRNSPGITQADLLTIPASRRGDFAVSQGLVEQPTLRCAHCGTMVILNMQRTRARGYCAPCDHYICDNPICHQGCNPLLKQLDTAQELAGRALNIKEI